MFITAKGKNQDRNCTGEGINVIDLIMPFCWKIVEMSVALRWKKTLSAQSLMSCFMGAQ